MQRRMFGLSAVALLVLLSAGCSSKKTAQNPVEIQNLRYQQWSDGTRVVTGVVRNRTNQAIADLQLEVGLYDQHNRLVGTMHVLVQDIPPRGRKRFRQVVDAKENVQGVRVRSVLLL
ncbi:FxLYD domain-containing protein [Rhodothermus bifroesti]|uniref:Lipoprotein n=1 Tax=Rhodothermus marinus TaxID=29549 RepID=A0A7V2B2X5_RHOMR|nr:FxLYD domain-containing protein [Rhodothermus bifroesti]